MIILSIKEKGLLFELDKITFRTPIKIDITKKNITAVINSLKKAGVIKYSIISQDEKKEKNNKIEKNKNEETKTIINKNEKIETKNETIELFENLFKIVDEKFNYICDRLEESKIDKLPNKRNKKIKDDVEEFIPNLKIDSFKTNIK